MDDKYNKEIKKLQTIRKIEANEYDAYMDDRENETK